MPIILHCYRKFSRYGTNRKKEKKTKTSTIFPLYYCGILVIVYEKHAKVNIAVFV